MRTDRIKVSLEIPVPIDKPDGNGVLYTEEAIIKACSNANSKPLITYNSKGKSVPIGVTTNVRYVNGNIFVEGMLWHGGTNEAVAFDKNKIVSMEIEGFGFTD